MPHDFPSDAAIDTSQFQVQESWRNLARAGEDQLQTIFSYETAKRGLDLVVAIPVLVLIAPVLAVVALCIKLWDRDTRTYNYFLEISPDSRTYHRVADKSSKGGSSWQNVLFPPQKVRRVRLHGLRNSENSVFHVVEIEGYEIADPEDMDNPIVP